MYRYVMIVYRAIHQHLVEEDRFAALAARLECQMVGGSVLVFWCPVDNPPARAV